MIKPIDVKEVLGMAFGFLLVIILALLARGIGVNEVKADTSFGLDIVLGGLVAVAGNWAGWAFPRAQELLK